MPTGYKFTPTQIENLRRGHLGQKAWNTGSGGCKRGHDPKLYIKLPSGVYVCLACKRENGAKYRAENRGEINLKNRVGRYNITIDEYNSLIASQSGKCAICGTELNKKNIRIDHHHKTGKVRGLLCVSCNTGIGLLKDSASTLLKASRYLEGNRAK